VQTDQPFFRLLCAGVAGGCIGFLPFNFRPKPASAFLGDAGSTMLGFLLASIAIVGEWGGTNDITLDIVVPLLILGVPIFDTTFITLTRIADGRIRGFREWIEYTGRDHIHHRLLNLGLGRHDTVGFICTISAVLSLSAITLMDATGPLAIISLIQGAIILTIVGRFMLFVENNATTNERSGDGSAL
jgi:UDP-GlcNAc:undecaprenyl-phosphate GlcNAc-1-phosphate transferase